MEDLHQRMTPPAGLRVVVTGAGSGIGLAIAEAFVASGATVRVSDVDEAAVEAFSARGGARSHVVGDASDAGDVDSLIRGAAGAFGGLDVVVANAGIAGPTAEVGDIDPADWDRTLEINLRGAYLAARSGAEALRASSGLFIGIASVAGRLGFPNRTPYAASKWGLIGFVKSLALELGPDGVRANAILPGIVAGPRQDRVLEARAQRTGATLEETRTLALKTVALRRMVTAEEIAGACLYLASPLGTAITGQALSVCAGVESIG